MATTITRDDRIHRCHDCGEIGRVKEVLKIRGRLKVLCHDEEKSCFNYVLMKAQEGILRVG
jgi:uncharacterized Zn finger protein